MLLDWVGRQTNLAYADETWSPISDITLGIIARQMGAALVERELGADVQEMGIPGYLGPPVIAVNRSIAPGLKRLALRHGLAHLVAGELEPEEGAGVRFMSSVTDWMTLEERRADLFALADLVPDRVLTEWRARGLALEAAVAREIRRYAPAWPAGRVGDRVALRLRLATDLRS